ncbi:hypothetical protein L6R52_22540 [Myxococcota bacterium]|nr:hypothetical protein [Myxococcota bacterium]
MKLFHEAVFAAPNAADLDFETGRGVVIFRRRWTRALVSWKAARDAGEPMAVLFGDAAYNTQGIVGWAIVEAIRIEDRTTECHYRGLLPVPKGRHATELKKLVDGEPVGRSRRGTYNAVKTPLFLRDAAALVAHARRTEEVSKEVRVQPVGAPYAYARATSLRGAAEPFDVDPDMVDRGRRAHADLQNNLARLVERHSLVPLSPGPADPEFDLAWRRDDTLFVAEVKSTTLDNEESQLRLGLGQVLRYRHLLAKHASGPRVLALLVTEHEPKDPTWVSVCREVGVHLHWPENLEHAFTNTDATVSV